MKTKYTFTYPVIITKSVEIDLEELAESIIEDTNSSDPDQAMNYFGDNMEYFLRELGFLDDIEFCEFDDTLDNLFDEIYDDLLEIITEKINDLR